MKLRRYRRRYRYVWHDLKWPMLFPSVLCVLDLMRREAATLRQPFSEFSCVFETESSGIFTL